MLVKCLLIVIICLSLSEAESSESIKGNYVLLQDSAVFGNGSINMIIIDSGLTFFMVNNYHGKRDTLTELNTLHSLGDSLYMLGWIKSIGKSWVTSRPEYTAHKIWKHKDTLYFNALVTIYTGVNKSIYGKWTKIDSYKQLDGKLSSKPDTSTLEIFNNKIKLGKPFKGTTVFNSKVIGERIYWELGSDDKPNTVEFTYKIKGGLAIYSFDEYDC
jgi:hypothetical protein